MKTIKEFKETLIQLDLYGDPWGTTMSAWFDIAEILYCRGDNIPPEWEFRPSPLIYDLSGGYLVEELSELSSDTLRKLGNLLSRYTRILKFYGRNY